MYKSYRFKNGNTKISHAGKVAIWNDGLQRFTFNDGISRVMLEQARRDLCRR